MGIRKTIDSYNRTGQKYDSIAMGQSTTNMKPLIRLTPSMGRSVMRKRVSNTKYICRLIIWIFSIGMFTLYGLPFIERMILCSVTSENPFI